MKRRPDWDSLLQDWALPAVILLAILALVAFSPVIAPRVMP